MEGAPERRARYAILRDRMSTHPQATIPLSQEIRTTGGRVRPVVRTITEALRLIDRELPAELRCLTRWTFAKALLEVAGRTGSKKDISTASRQLRQALSNEGWLAAPKASDVASRVHANRETNSGLRRSPLG